MIGVTRRRVMGGGGVLPYDAEIEYLESTGTQYIDTGIALTSDMEMGISFSIVGFQHNSMVCGANAQDKYPRSGLYSIGMFVYNGIIYSTNYNATTTSAIDFGTATSRIISVVKKDNKTYFEGELVSEVTAVSTYSAGGNCYIAWAGGAHTQLAEYKGKIKCASFYLKDANDNYLFDGIPVRVGNVGYMYDKVSGELFGNEGTGDFVLGPDVT